MSRVRSRPFLFVDRDLLRDSYSLSNAVICQCHLSTPSSVLITGPRSFGEIPVPSQIVLMSCRVLSLSHLPLIFVHVSKCGSLTSIVCETLGKDLLQGTGIWVKYIVSRAFFLGTPLRTITTSSSHTNSFLKNILCLSLCQSPFLQSTWIFRITRTISPRR